MLMDLSVSYHVSIEYHDKTLSRIIMAFFSLSCAPLFLFTISIRVTTKSVDIVDQLKYSLLKYHDLHSHV